MFVGRKVRTMQAQYDRLEPIYHSLPYCGNYTNPKRHSQSATFKKWTLLSHSRFHGPWFFLIFYFHLVPYFHFFLSKIWQGMAMWSSAYLMHGTCMCSFNGLDLLKRLKGKKILFVGDSISLNQWQSLTCMLHATVPKLRYSVTRREEVSTFAIPVSSSRTNANELHKPKYDVIFSP